MTIAAAGAPPGPASPARGSRELCARRLEIPARNQSAPHRVSREEVLYILSGTIRAIVDDSRRRPPQAT